MADQGSQDGSAGHNSRRTRYSSRRRLCSQRLIIFGLASPQESARQRHLAERTCRNGNTEREHRFGLLIDTDPDLRAVRADLDEAV